MSSTSYKGLILSASTAADGVECPGWRTYGKVPPKHCPSPTGEKAILVQGLFARYDCD